MPFRLPKFSLCLALVCAITFADYLSKSSADDRPNIILIMADDLGYGDISPYGGWIKTPNLEKLAAGGVLLTDFHSSGNVCSPTRAGLMTGQYQQRLGLDKVIVADPKRPVHYHGLQTETTTFAELLQDAGYRTAILGKWHLGYETKYNPTHHGFEQFRGYVSGNIDFFSHVDQAGKFDWWKGTKLEDEKGYTTDLITQHALKFIEASQNRPFCLYLPHEAPHYPYQGPNDKPLRTVGGKFNNQGARKDIRQAYTEMVQRMDEGIGQIIKKLDDLKIADNTLVIFISDNGANRRGSNKPLRGNKGSNWEGGHRVPAIFHWPAQFKAGKNHKLAISLDIMPTILYAARVEKPAKLKLDGINLVPTLRGENLKKPAPRQLFWNGQAMRDGKWKLMVTGKGNTQKTQLFDLSKDIGETKDVSAQHPDQVKFMKNAIAAWKKDVNSPKPNQPNEYAEKAAKAAREKAKK